MAFQSIWYNTNMPPELVDLVMREIKPLEEALEPSKLYGGGYNEEKRKSKNAWVTCNSWVGGFCMSYIERANRENFHYDIDGFDGEHIQFTSYGPGDYYGWHCDGNLSGLFQPGNTHESRPNDFVMLASEKCRKLSFVLQLSDPEEYEGGEFQLMDDAGRCYFAPKSRGTVIIFDSRAQHRAKRVLSGTRKSLVGWIVGPRWK